MLIACALYVCAGEWQHAAALLSDDGQVQVGDQLINGRQGFEQYLKDTYPFGASRDGWKELSYIGRYVGRE